MVVRTALVTPAPPRAPTSVSWQPGKGSAGPWWRSWRRLRHDHAAVTGALLLGAVASVVLAAPLVVHIDLYQQSLGDALRPPGTWDHPLEARPTRGC